MAKKNRLERVLVISDLHCGHRAGIMTPKYQSGRRKYVLDQASKWEWFEETLIQAAPFDKVVWVGDMIDGTGVKNPSETVLNLNDQIKCAVDVVRTVNCPKNLFVYGTMIHTSTKDGLESEEEIAEKINGEDNPNIWSQAWFKIGDLVCDVRHAPASSSGVPHTRGNVIARERMANEQWYLKGLQPLAHLYLRGHVHFKYTAGVPGEWQGWTLSALQSPKTKFGRKLSNTVDVGIGILESTDNWPIKPPTFEIYGAPVCQEAVLNW